MKANRPWRDLLVFVAFIAVVHLVTLALGLQRTWWATAEPWTLLVLWFGVQIWRAMGRRSGVQSAG